MGQNRILAGVASKRPTLGLSPFDIINGGISTYYATRPRERTIQFVRLMREIRDFTPDASKAVENMITLCNPGYTLNAFKNQQPEDSGTPKPDYAAQQVVEQFASRMFGEYSANYDFGNSGSKNFAGLNTFINMCHLVAFTQGAFAAEVGLTGDLSDIEDVYPVDPVFIDFFKVPPLYKWTPGIYSISTDDKQAADGRGFYPLDSVMFCYAAKDPDVNAPFGRSPMIAIMDIVFFQQQMMKELKAITHATNVPRLNITVIEETINKIIEDTRPDLKGPENLDKRQIYFDERLSDLMAQINSMEADDAFIHYDAVQAEYIAPEHLSIPVADIFDAIDKAIVAALKQLPVLLGRNEGATTTHATVQWQVFIKQIENFQQISVAVVTWLFNLLLRVHGFDSHIEFVYNKHQTSDDFLDAQTLNMNIMSWTDMVNNGWADSNEASYALLKHDAKLPNKMAEDAAAAKQSGLPGQPSPVVQDASEKAAGE